jgi:hypothetical protein
MFSCVMSVRNIATADSSLAEILALFRSTGTTAAVATNNTGTTTSMLIFRSRLIFNPESETTEFHVNCIFSSAMIVLGNILRDFNSEVNGEPAAHGKFAATATTRVPSGN